MRITQIHTIGYHSFEHNHLAHSLVVTDTVLPSTSHNNGIILLFQIHLCSIAYLARNQCSLWFYLLVCISPLDTVLISLPHKPLCGTRTLEVDTAALQDLVCLRGSARHSGAGYPKRSTQHVLLPACTALLPRRVSSVLRLPQE